MRLRKLASNAAYLTMDWISITILSSLFWIISGKLLSSTELGVVSTAFNFASILQFFGSLGIGIALSKLISEFASGSKENELSIIISPTIKLLLISNLLLAVIVFVFSSSISQVIKLTTEVILVAIALSIFLSISNIAGYVIIGFQNMRKLMITNLVYHITKLAISVALVSLGFSFFGPLLGITLGLFLLIIIRLDSFRLFKFSLSFQSHHNILRYSVPAFIGGIAALMFNNVPYITLTAVQDLSITGIFTPAMLLATPLFIFPSIFTSALFPIVSNLSDQIKKSNEESHLVNIVFRYTIFLTLPLAIFIILFSDQLILLLFKPEYLKATELLKILAIGALFQGVSGIFLSTIYAMKRPKTQQNILILSSLIFFLLSLPLTYYLAAIGMSIAYIISTLALFLLSYFYVKKLIDVNLSSRTILKILIASIFMVGFILFTKPILSNMYSLVLILPSLAIYFFTLLFLNFYNHIDLRLVEFLSSRAPKRLKPPLNFVYRLLQTRLKNTS